MNLKHTEKDKGYLVLLEVLERLDCALDGFRLVQKHSINTAPSISTTHYQQRPLQCSRRTYSKAKAKFGSWAAGLLEYNLTVFGAPARQPHGMAAGAATPADTTDLNLEEYETLDGVASCDNERDKDKTGLLLVLVRALVGIKTLALAKTLMVID